MRIFIAGDSTAAVKEQFEHPETGWGEPFRFLLNQETHFVNYAKNGASTKTFIKEGYLERIHQEMQAGDYLLIQFGHNDGNEAYPDRYVDAEGAYRDNLMTMIEIAKQKEATPILITSIPRGYFEDGKFVKNSLGKYPQVMRELALELGVALIDVNAELEKFFSEMGPKKTQAVFLHLLPGEHPNYPLGRIDNTHLSPSGAHLVSNIIYHLLQDSSLKGKGLGKN